MTLQSLDLDICIWWSLSRSCLRNSSSLWTCTAWTNLPFLLHQILTRFFSLSETIYVLHCSTTFWLACRMCDQLTQIHPTATMLCTHQPSHLSNRLIPSFSLCSPVLLNPFVHVLPETLAASPSWPAAFVSCTRFPLQSCNKQWQCLHNASHHATEESADPGQRGQQYY